MKGRTGGYGWLAGSLLWVMLWLSSCHYTRPDLASDGLSEKARDSLYYLYTYHYTLNSNFEVRADSVQLERFPVKGSYVILRKGAKVVVAELAIRHEAADSLSSDSVYVKLAHNQEAQGWISDSELRKALVPVDVISQWIYLFSDTHAAYFVVIFALFVGAYLVRALLRKQIRLVYFNDIDSIYPLFLCLLLSFSATLYESIQVFVPDTWEHFYFNPTLSPFKVPFILSVFLASIWLFVVFSLAVLDDLFRQLTPASAVVYLLGLMSCCIFCYFFFILTTSIYIGYLFLACFVYVFVRRARRHRGYRYLCGNCGGKLKEKGLCPHCGAVNE